MISPLKEIVYNSVGGVEEPVLEFDPQSHDFGVVFVGYNYDNYVLTDFSVWNDGGGILTCDLVESCSWITVSPSYIESTGEAVVITVNASVGTLTPPGVYSCDIEMSSNGGTGIFTVTIESTYTAVMGVDLDKKGRIEGWSWVDSVYASDEIISFQISVTNTGTEVYRLFEIKDTLPESLVYLGNANIEPSFQNDEIIFWNFSRLQPGDSVIIEFDMRPTVNGDFLNHVKFHGHSSMGGTIVEDEVTISISDIELQSEFTSAEQIPGQLTVQFNTTTTGGTPPYYYEWDFGDGSTARGYGYGNPKQVYLINKDTTYFVTYNVTDSEDRLIQNSFEITVELPYDATVFVDQVVKESDSETWVKNIKVNESAILNCKVVIQKVGQEPVDLITYGVFTENLAYVNGSSNIPADESWAPYGILQWTFEQISSDETFEITFDLIAKRESEDEFCGTEVYVRKEEYNTVAYEYDINNITIFDTIEDDSPSIIYVDDDGSANFTIIQDAINAAEPYSTIFVYSGTYYEQIVIDKPLKLIGENRDTTIIHGGTYSGGHPQSYNAIILAYEFNNVTIKGFTVENTSGRSRGINLKHCPNSTITNNIIRDIPGGYGIDIGGSNCLVTNNIIQNCYSGVDALRLHNSVISHNIIQSERDGIDSYESENLEILSNIVSGGGIHDSYSKNNKISKNTIADSGIYCNDAENIEIIFNTIQNGGLYLGDAQFCQVASNTISLGDDRGLYINNVTRGQFIDNIISDHEQEGIYLRDSKICTFTGNTITKSNRGMFIQDVEDLTIYENLFLDNSESNLWIMNPAADILIYHNNFINHGNKNYEPTSSTLSSVVFDNGYPSGGNHWDDYTGEDLFSGPNQDESGSDGIGDFPYSKGMRGSLDRYPYMNQDGWIRTFSIISPNEITEDTLFTIKIVENSDPIENIKVEFNNEIKYTNHQGFVDFFAPVVQVDTYYSIVASKLGYHTQEISLLVSNVKPVTIRLLSPKGGETLQGIHGIDWSIKSTKPLENYAVTIQLRYEEGDWSTIGKNIDAEQTTLNWDSRNVADGYPYTMKVILKRDKNLDGFYETTISEDSSEAPFAIDNSQSHRGWIQGVVTEKSGNITSTVENAVVCLLLSTTDDIITSKCILTDPLGNYILPATAGVYTVVVRKTGYITQNVSNITVWPSEITQLDFTLQKGTSTDPEIFFIPTYREDINSAIIKEQIGGEISVYQGEFDIEKYIIIYDTISIEPLEISNKQILLLINGDEQSRGKTLVINLDNTIFTEEGEIQITYDGKPIDIASNISDILNPNDDGALPEYVIVQSAEGIQILISIPHFSEHEILIQTLKSIFESRGGFTTVLVYTLVCFIGALIASVHISYSWRKK